ncbi:MAG: hypothetical protein R3B96_20360 [Pirellulaceae bacterium]
MSGRAESFGREARSLSTYYEYPIESERLRLIGEFTAPTTRRDDKDAAKARMMIQPMRRNPATR